MNMKKMALSFLLYCVCLFHTMPVRATPRRYVLPPELAWTQEQWTGADQPFVRIRRSIDQMLASGQKPDDLLQRYRALGQKKPLDAQAQFRWAYAAERAVAAQHKSTEIDERLQGVAEAMARPVSPRSYQYARLRYSIEVRGTTWRANNIFLTQELGKRLVKRDSRDYDIKYNLTRALLSSENLHERNVLTVQYAHEIQTARPTRPSSYALLGWVYSNLFWGTHSSKHADTAIANYRKYLELAPPDREFRKEIPKAIRNLEEDKQRYKRLGKLKP